MKKLLLLLGAALVLSSSSWAAKAQVAVSVAPDVIYETQPWHIHASGLKANQNVQIWVRGWCDGIGCNVQITPNASADKNGILDLDVAPLYPTYLPHFDTQEGMFVLLYKANTDRNSYLGDTSFWMQP